MIQSFEIFEKQLKLFNLPPTDTDVANTFIDKHKIKKHNKTKKWDTLIEAFNSWSDESWLSSLVFDELGTDNLYQSNLVLKF